MRAGNKFRRLNMTVEKFDRITQEPGIMGGKPCIRGMRVTVSNILSQIGSGETIEELLEDYPYLEREDILQTLQYAAWLAEGREVAFMQA
jgi:uncharacterized protein (DUF433 family)